MSQPSQQSPLEEIAEFFACGPSVAEIAAFRLSDTTVARTRELLRKSAADGLSRNETEELDQLVILDRLVTLIHSKLPQRPIALSTPTGNGETPAALGLAPYHVVGPPRRTDLEAWSARRLPYEPSGWLRDLREDIQATLQALTGDPHRVLHAVYGSSDTSSCDAENVLFYNVGLRPFAHLAQHGIRFERAFSFPSPPVPIDQGALHYHHYYLADVAAGFSYRQAGRTLAQWSNVLFPRITTSLQAAAYWLPIRSCLLDQLHLPSGPIGPYGISIMISKPVHASTSIVGSLKCLLDGVISAFHVHDGNNLEQHSNRLGLALGIDADLVTKLLLATDRAVLGKRQLLWDNGNWNPRDDQCLAAEVLTQPSPDALWRISGRLFELAVNPARYSSCHPNRIRRPQIRSTP